jgi:hypothetical protein
VACVGVGGGDGSVGVLCFLSAGRSRSRGARSGDDGGVVVVAYSMGQRSSRAIERECVEDIAYRVIAANRKPDHATLARFVVRHEAAVAELFGEVLSLCADAGMVKVGVVAIDGTKVHANASQHGRDSNPRWTETLIPVFESVAVGGWSASTPRPLGSLRALSGRQSCTP